MGNLDLEDLLKQWNKDILGSTKYRAYLPQEALDSRWIGYPGATEAQIEEAEVRLGTTLPHSYRTFLGVTNGLLLPGPFVHRLLPAEQTDWLLKKSRDRIDAWRYGRGLFGEPEHVPDASLFVYGEAQNPLVFRDEYLDTALQISEGHGLYLLNPRVVFEDAEWEAWFFEAELGASRYRSFGELILAEYEAFLRLKDL